jgi:hypothetical protein
MNPEHLCLMCGATKPEGTYYGRPVCAIHFADGTLTEWLLTHPQGFDGLFCTWTEEEDGPWWTDCANVFTLDDDDDGDPAENGMRYCCFCGKRLKATSAGHVL